VIRHIAWAVAVLLGAVAMTALIVPGGLRP
jgi:hypothetical protein